MVNDLFVRLFKYKQKANHSPLENYLTEQFAYIFQFLIDQEETIVLDLFKLFDIPEINLVFSNIKIETQWETWVEKYSCFARPDIKIEFDNKKIYFIEVKVDSDLNQYNDFDQIQLYEAISIPEMKNCGVRTLTKYQICTRDRKYRLFKETHKVFWRQVYKLFSDKTFYFQRN